MSHFSQIKTQFRDKDCLIKALEAMGFHPSKHNEPIPLFGYLGDVREEKAHIIVKRNQIDRASNDLGFRWNGEAYEMIISNYYRNWGKSAPKRGLGPQFQHKLTAEYQCQVALAEGCEITGREVLANGTIRIVAKKVVHQTNQARMNVGGVRK